jgi:osmoprotectant transport system permease protein
LRPKLERTGILMAGLAWIAILVFPFVVVKPNRILQGQGLSLAQALPSGGGIALTIVLLVLAMLLVIRLPISTKLALATAAVVLTAVTLGIGARAALPSGNSYARVAPASGFWLMLFAFALAAVDALARLRPSPRIRLLLVVLVIAMLGAILASDILSAISVIQEYTNRVDAFWAEMTRHVLLALGSMIVAFVLGVPLGVLCQRVSWLRTGALNSLNIFQTIPSIALFGLLILPLGWFAAHVPGAAAIGISGIGGAPAFVALVLYSLLPVVANTVAGLEDVPREANEAARGAGMTDWQRMIAIELPLSLPSLLAAIRIVLIQNIGMATIAALIGGGGLGVFVFQGLGQSAMDLVLLGALPTVAMAFVAAVVLDALVDLAATGATGARTE